MAHMAREEAGSRSSRCTREEKKAEGLRSTGKLGGWGGCQDVLPGFLTLSLHLTSSPALQHLPTFSPASLPAGSTAPKLRQLCVPLLQAGLKQMH